MNLTVDASGNDGDWAYLLNFLPAGWEEEAWSRGALRRCREFADAETLLRTLLIYLVDGCSLRETVVRAKAGGIVDVNDTSLMRRLRNSGEWFRWMAAELMQGWVPQRAQVVLGGIERRIRMVDATCVTEPWSKGTNWRVHYSIDLPELRCHELLVSDQGIGETFRNFQAEEGCLYIGDRGYCHRPGIKHMVSGGADVLVRINLHNLPLSSGKGSHAFRVLPRARRLARKEVGDWDVWFLQDGHRVEGRVCAIRKSKAAAEQTRQEILKEHSKKQRKVKPETLEAARYIILFTTLSRDEFPAELTLEIYRGRWQVEIAFKRLKSLLGMGHVPKKDPVSTKAWFHGKILCAFLVEKLIEAGEAFFPWGYPLAIETVENA